MERWMGSRTVRWAIALAVGVLVLVMGLTKFRAGAEEAKETPPKTPAARPKREALRYGGKNFDRWRIEMETELKPEVRADGMAAMAAFGANGYAVEATRTIVDLMADYCAETTDTKDKAVVEAADEAVRKIGKPAFPVLWESLHGNNEQSRRFACVCFLRFETDWHPRIPELLKAVKDGEASLRWAALRLLHNVRDKPESCLPILCECLKDKNHIQICAEAMRNLGTMGPNAKNALPKLRKLLEEPIAEEYFCKDSGPGTIISTYSPFRGLIDETIKKIEGK